MDQRPIGLHLARTARTVTQAFERAMAEAGGSRAAFQVLLLVQAETWGNQARIAAALGITSATLTHHLNALERDGLVRRWRDPANRRVQHTALTPTGEELFARLREVALRHDERLRASITEAEAAILHDVLAKLAAAVGEPPAPGPGDQP